MCENYGDVSTNQAPKAIPATPAPSIPPGLRQRFQPFGSKTPTLSGVEPESSPVPSASSSNPGPYLPRQLVRQEEEEEETRKKRKREKRSLAMEGGGEEEERALISVKTEPVAPEGLEETDPREEKRKKKKKKRDKDRGAGDEESEGLQGLGITVKEEVDVKDERLDSAYGDVEDSGKKRKKKKKNRQEDD